MISSPVVGWTDSKFRSWVIALLRRGSLRFPNRTEVLKEAKTKKKINKTSGRMAQHYRCAGCKKEFPMSQICVDHIEPVVDVNTGFVSWDNYITRMFCPKENLQVLCSACHDVKTEKERKKR